MNAQTPEAVAHIRINDRIAPVDLVPGTPVRVRWWPVQGATAYRVTVADRPDAEAPLWRSGLVDGAAATIEGLVTSPSARYWVTVESVDEDGGSAASAPMTFGTAPAADGWTATPIWADRATASSGANDSSPAFSELTEDSSDAGDAFFQRPTIKQTEHNGLGWAFLHGEFDAPDEPVLWATLHMTAVSVKTGRQFVYRAWLNGAFVGLGPTFPTGDEARTDGFDVTGLIRPGARNAIGVVAWTLEDQRFLAQLDLGLADGRVLHLGNGGDADAAASSAAVSWTGIVGNAAYPDSLSSGTQYCESPSEDLQAQRYPFDLATAHGCAGWPAAAVRDPFASLKPNPADKVTVDYRPAAKATRIGAGRVVLDFGRAWMGGIRLHADAGQDIDLRIRYGEVLNPDGTVKYQLSAFNTYEETWHIPAGSPAVESWGLKVFRYVELIGADDAASRAAVDAVAAHPETVDAAAIVYPFDGSAADFRCDDATVSEVWRFCRNTIEAFNGPIYADSWTRERAAYEADAWLQWRSHLALDDAPTLGAYSVDYLIANRTWPTEWPLYLVIAVHDAWMATGSTAQAQRDYEQLLGLLPDRYLDEASGLIVKDPGDSSVMDGDLVDWPPAERDGFVFGRVNTVINALASQAYACMGELAQALGRDGDAKRLNGIAARMRDAINDRLFDDVQGAYVDGLDSGADGASLGHASEHASAFALAFADVPADRRRRLANFIEAKGMACSVYAAAILLDGLYRAGFGELANRLIASHERPRSWWNMIRSGAGATSEGWDVSIKGNTTYSHPWAASPAFLLPQGMLGIRPVAPGYREFEVRPQLAPFHEASASVPTPLGPIVAHAQLPLDPESNAAKRTDADAPAAPKLTLRVPAGATAHVSFAGEQRDVQGPATVTI